jgi:hypothetical protein
MRRLAILAALLGLSGCSRERAKPEDCQRIFDRLVEVELHELGYRDPALAQRRHEELRKLLTDEAARCVGGRMRPDALVCVERAQKAEEIVHQCLE